MNLQKAINESDNSKAINEYNGLYAVVNGDTDDAEYTVSVSFGQEGFPTSEYSEVGSLDAAIAILIRKGWEIDEGWEPQGEAEV